MTSEHTTEFVVDQTIFADDPKRPGNCVSAAVATYLRKPLSEVPHFVELGIALGDSTDYTAERPGQVWWGALLGYMAAQGLWPAELDSVDDGEPGELLFVTGKSPRGLSHQVLYRDGALFHDPHPSRDGVLDVSAVLAWRPGYHDHAPTPKRNSWDGE